MTKIEIVANVYEKLGFSKRECADIVDKFFEVIKETLASGENVKISGFGNFIVKQKKARRGRNPQTGDEIEIAKRKVLNYRLSQVLKDAINNTK
ncbi:MAG TPA: integration host factor subunit alpha [Syntrophorhabdaceae bacterium]|jgi:integration host factor subunit alpha|nr:integration host factor subunit alpha [Syntrophorhabdaceae bacterium]MDI9560569.1 integration host factor subunit alpha [Pseudomonadota bacterium]MBP8698191.1 integration host factor subunit alpha [Syntrophorhabdaceae bacterium]MBV6506796.1 Integration host factor subunit alpha [Syntrophorhabdaceae bacterium]HNQ62974.1 integration host factor subunit alpha [Syntrophorhabdaceae bacterium]